MVKLYNNYLLLIIKTSKKKQCQNNHFNKLKENRNICQKKRIVKHLTYFYVENQLHVNIKNINTCSQNVFLHGKMSITMITLT